MNRPVVEIDDKLCVGCGLCAKVCPEGAISVIFEKAKVNPLLCTGCGYCLGVCRSRAIHWGDEEAPRKVPKRPFLGPGRAKRRQIRSRQQVLRRTSLSNSEINGLRQWLEGLKEKAEDIVKRVEQL
jgi:NAD-dependent dihydropyrimidine dehydrogenase PreA subunit